MPSKKKEDFIAQADVSEQTVFAAQGDAQELMDNAGGTLPTETDASISHGVQDQAADAERETKPEDETPPAEALPVESDPDGSRPDEPVKKAKPKKAPTKRKTTPKDDNPGPSVGVGVDPEPLLLPEDESDTVGVSPKAGSNEVGEALMIDAPLPAEDTAKTKAAASQPKKRAPRKAKTDLNVLKIDVASEISTPEDQDDWIWHEIHNAYRTRRILTGTLDGVEPLDTGETRAIIDYKGFRIAVTMDEMMIVLPDSPQRLREPPSIRKRKLLNAMIHAEVDFIVRGINSKTRSVVASRKDAMMKKRQLFYFNTDDSGQYRIYEGRIVQARVIAVAEKLIRVEVFGAECTIVASYLSWEWIGDARDHYSVGEHILVRIRELHRESPEELSISADVRSIRSPDGSENLKKCKVQGKYAGTVIDVNRGVVLVRLAIGANAIAHACFDRRMPGKKDDVTFVVTHVDEEKGVAMGIITRINKQNL